MSKTVFVGNIPYDHTEEQLIDIFKQIGPVSNFKLVFDNATGRCKGYGFCEFLDASSAQSAVRNLDGYDLGSRQIRVAFSDQAGGASGRDANTPSAPAPVHTAHRFTVPPPGAIGGLPFPPPGTVQQSSALPPMPPGIPPAAGLTAEDAISKTLQVFPPMQLLDIVTQFKQLATGNPAQAELLLQQSPQLSYAVLQALLLMNLVDAAVLTRVIAGGPAVPASQQQQPQQAATQQMPAQTDPRLATTSAPPARVGPSPMPPQQRSTTASPAVPAAQQASAGQMDPQKESLVRQIMSMTDAQIQAFPIDQRNQILFVKKQIQEGTFVMTV